MGVAIPNRSDIINRLRDEDDEFSISPMPLTRSVGSGTVDLSIGTVFMPAERSAIPSVRIEEKRVVGAGNSIDVPLFAEVRVHPKGTFVMQPRQFILTATFEYLSMPHDLAGLIQSRSTFGRMGIISATAAYVAPGFKGCPTLEVLNAGEVPIELNPYRHICQLVLMSADEPEPKISRYHLSTRPWPARVAADS